MTFVFATTGGKHSVPVNNGIVDKGMRRNGRGTVAFRLRGRQLRSLSDAVGGVNGAGKTKWKVRRKEDNGV